MADGIYSFEILATDVNDRKVRTTPFFNGTVDKVTFENDTSFLISGEHKIALGDVIQVADPKENETIDNPASDSTYPASQSSNPLINGGR